MLFFWYQVFKMYLLAEYGRHAIKDRRILSAQVTETHLSKQIETLFFKNIFYTLKSQLT